MQVKERCFLGDDQQGEGSDENVDRVENSDQNESGE